MFDNFKPMLSLHSLPSSAVGDRPKEFMETSILFIGEILSHTLRPIDSISPLQ